LAEIYSNNQYNTILDLFNWFFYSLLFDTCGISRLPNSLENRNNPIVSNLVLFSRKSYYPFYKTIINIRKLIFLVAILTTLWAMGHLKKMWLIVSSFQQRRNLLWKLPLFRANIACEDTLFHNYPK
jgi:hypothetical protein